MATNQFLPFGISGNAPVLPQAQWAALVPANGFGPGLVTKEKFNKAVRQPSAMAAALGLFIAQAGFDALDNGDIPGLTNNFIAALGTHQAALPTDLVHEAEFAHQLAPAGFQFLPGGLLIQWLTATVDAGNYTQLAWPRPFPNAVFGVLTGINDSALYNTSVSVYAITQNGARIDSPSNNRQITFLLAIGY